MAEQNLILRLENAYDELGISSEQQNSIDSYLEVIKIKDLATWEHSMRVGLMGVEVSKFTHIVEPKALLYPGLLHDVGKILVNSDSLKKKEGFNDKDMKELEKHVKYTYDILKDIHPFSAEVALRHHIFKIRGAYPKRLPPWGENYSGGTKALIVYCSRILSIIDFYDAAKYRTGNKFGEEKNILAGDEVRGFLLEHNKDQDYFIKELYGVGIFK